MLSSRYPLSRLWDQGTVKTHKVWCHVLADVPYADVEQFLDGWIRTEEFPPDPAAVRTGVKRLDRERKEAQRSQDLVDGYRPALGEGWMRRAKRPTATNLDITKHVVELADAWRRGEIGLDSVRRQCEGVFDMPGGYARFVANHHARDQVKDLIEALAAEDDARERIIRTSFGGFTCQDLHEHGGLLTTVNGERRLVWPVSGSGRGSWRYRTGGG